MNEKNILTETCLNCGKTLRFTPDDICTDDFGDYIKCPDCGAQSDVNVSCETKLNEYISTEDRPIYDAVESISDYACQLTPGDDIAEDYDNDLVFYIHRNDEDTFDISVGYKGEFQYNLSKSDVDILDLDTTLVNIVKSMYKQSDVDKKEELFNVKIDAGNEVLSKKQEGRKKKDSVTEYTITFSDGELYDEYDGEFISEDKDEADELFDSIKAENKLDQVEQYYAKTWIWEGSDYSEDDVKVYYTKGDSINESCINESSDNKTINQYRIIFNDGEYSNIYGGEFISEDKSDTDAIFNEIKNKNELNQINQYDVQKFAIDSNGNYKVISDSLHIIYPDSKVESKECEDAIDSDSKNIENVRDILQKSGIKTSTTLDLMSKDILKDLKQNYTKGCSDDNGIFYNATIVDAIQNKIAEITGKKPSIKFGESKDSQDFDVIDGNQFVGKFADLPDNKKPMSYEQWLNSEDCNSTLCDYYKLDSEEELKNFFINNDEVRALYNDVYLANYEPDDEDELNEARRNPKVNTINKGNSKMDFSNTKRNKFRSVDQANRNFFRDLQGNSAKGSGTWEENPNETSAEYINNKKEIASNNELINKGKTLSSDDNRLQDVVNNVNQELIKKNQDLKDRNKEIIANKNKKKLNKKQEANEKFNQYKSLEETTHKGLEAKKKALADKTRQKLKDNGVEDWEKLTFLSKKLSPEDLKEYLREEDEIWAIEMIHSILTYTSKDYWTVDYLMNNKYMAKYIKSLGEDKLRQIIADEIAEFENATIENDVYTDSEDVSYNSVTFKDESKETSNKKYPRKIKTADGYILTKVNDGTPENEYIPVYMNERGDETLVPDVEKYEIIEEAEEENPQAYEYMLLDRLRSDCDYYLGNGNRNDKYLWAGNVDGQIAKMKELWNKLNEKPEWLTMEQIENYAKEMGANELPSSTDGTAKQEIQNMLDRAYNKETKVGLDEDYGDDDSNKEHYYFNIILSTSNPNASDFKKLSHHIENLIDYNEFDYPIDIYNVEVKPDTDNTVIVKGNMDITFDEDPLSQEELTEYLYDFIDVDAWSDLDVEIESISLQLTESKKSLTEREWKYKFDNLIKSAINSGDTKTVIETVRRYCDDIQKADAVDSNTKSKFESYINYYNNEFNWVLEDIQNNPDDVRRFDDFMNIALSDLYDLCDEAGIFIELL